MRKKADLGATSHSFLLIKLRISHPGMTPHRPDDTFVLQFPPSPSAKMNSIFAFPLLLSHLNPTIKPLSPLEWMQSWPPSVHKYDIREPDPQFPSQRHWKKVWNNANKSEVIIFRNYLKHCAHLFFETAEFKGHHPTARVISERELEYCRKQSQTDHEYEVWIRQQLYVLGGFPSGWALKELEMVVHKVSRNATHTSKGHIT